MPFLKNYRNQISRVENLENRSKRHGLRCAIFDPNGNKYVGEWSNDRKAGKGVLITRSNYKYEGDFYNNNFNGFGILSCESRNGVFNLNYIGFWCNGKRHGFGIQKYRNGNVYIGYWYEGLRHGYGHLWYKNGEFYAGDFVRNKREGLGMLVLTNSNRYEGCWQNDLKEGLGRFLHFTTGQLQNGISYRNRCVLSEMHDMKLRQFALYPTPYPITNIQLLDVDKICDFQNYIDLCHQSIDTLKQLTIN